MDSTGNLDLPKKSDEGSNGDMSGAVASNCESGPRTGTSHRLVRSFSMQQAEQQLLEDDYEESGLDPYQRTSKSITKLGETIEHLCSKLEQFKLHFKNVQDAYADLQSKKGKLEEENKKLKLQNDELKQLVKSKDEELAAMVEAVKKGDKDEGGTIMEPVNMERPASPKRKRASNRSSAMSVSDVKMESSESNENVKSNPAS